MEYVVLGLLMLKSMTLYELNASFSAGLSMIYAASYGSLQHAVKKLLRSNMIVCDESVENARNKKTYHINPHGVDHFYQWMHQGLSQKNIETIMLAKIYFLGLIQDNADKKRIIQDMLTIVSSSIDSLTKVKEANHKIDVPETHRSIAKYQLSTLDYGLGSYAFAKTWLNQLLNDIED